MKIRQLSVFLENRVGVINDVTAILGKNNINMEAFSVTDGSEFGILRLIVSDIELATKVLREADFKVNITDVVRVSTPNAAGALSGVMECLASEGVFIQYMYAFSDGDLGRVIIRPTDLDRCIKILNEAGIE